MRNLKVAAMLSLGGLMVAGATAASAMTFGVPEPGQPGTIVHKAQIQFSFGTSDSRIRRSLRSAGYSEIAITDRGLTSATAEACKDGAKYLLKLSPSGRIRAADKIGNCKPPVTIEQVRRILRQDGFRSIDLAERGNIPYVASACRDGSRYDIQVNLYGDVKVGDRIGRCGQGLSDEQVADALRKEGYDRIEVKDRVRNRVVAEACQRGRRYDVTLNRRGAVVDRNQTGRCREELRPRNIATYLEGEGYNRVEVIDRRLPRYVAEACKDGRRLELTMNRYGRILRENRVGRCPPPITEAQLRRQMAQSGFERIQLTSTSQDQYTTIACKDKERMSIRFTRYGEVIDQERLGTCVSPRITRVLNGLEKDGMDRMTIYIDGCKGRSRMRYVMNEFGEKLKEEQIGRCLVRR